MRDELEILPKTVRNILKVNNDEIVRLCKLGEVPLKQNDKGLTYFTTEDVKTLKKMQDLQNKTKGYEENAVVLKNSLKKVPPKKSEYLPIVQKEQQISAQNAETIALLKQITGTVKNIETGFYDKFSHLLDEKLETKLEEKLGGIDVVIMDLVRCKAEADDMRKQLAENSKEIYALKNELSSYKKVVGNFYVKKPVDQIFEL